MTLHPNAGRRRAADATAAPALGVGGGQAAGARQVLFSAHALCRVVSLGLGPGPAI